MNDFLAQLDAELSEITAKASAASKLDALRKKANNNRIPQSDRAKAKAEFLELQAISDEFLWTSEAYIALFTEQLCDGCGSIHRTFLQYMQRQVNVRKATTIRYIRVSRLDHPLPRETLIQPLQTHICADCCEDHGFAISTSTDRLETSTSISASASYFQEDINATA